VDCGVFELPSFLVEKRTKNTTTKTPPKKLRKKERHRPAPHLWLAAIWQIYDVRRFRHFFSSAPFGLQGRPLPLQLQRHAFF
jgi:hypothetical protein